MWALGGLLAVLGLERGRVRFGRWEAEVEALRDGIVLPAERFQDAPWLGQETTGCSGAAVQLIRARLPLPLTGSFPLLIDGKPGAGEILRRSAEAVTVRLLEPLRTEPDTLELPAYAAGQLTLLGRQGDALVLGLLTRLIAAAAGGPQLLAALRDGYGAMCAAHRDYDRAVSQLRFDFFAGLPVALRIPETLLEPWLEQDWLEREPGALG